MKSVPVIAAIIRTLAKMTCQRLARSTVFLPFCSFSHIFSPWIVATTFLVCFISLNSKYQIPCHVPVASLPFVIGIVTLAPTSADLTCAYNTRLASFYCPFLTSTCPMSPFCHQGIQKYVQAYHHFPQHHVDTALPLFYLPAQCDLAHRSCQHVHPGPNFHSGSVRRMCAV